MNRNRLTISVRRHCDPKKDPNTGASLDELTEEGIQQARQIGSGIVVPKSGIIGYHSPKNRAYQTLVGIMQGAGIAAPEVNAEPRLDVLDMKGDYKTRALMHPDGKKRNYNELVQFCMDTPNPAETFEAAGQRIMEYIDSIILGNAGRDVYFESISHGPCVEAAIIGLLKQRADRKIGQVSEIGGGFKPGEGFKVVVEYDQKSEVYQAKLESRGESFKI